MGTRKTLRHVQRPFELVVLARERSLIAALTLPHAQADLDRLLQHLESLRKRWEGNAQTARFLLVPASADAQHRPAAGEDVERGHHLGEKGRMPEVHSGHQRHEPAPPRMGGDDTERGEALELRLLRATQVRALPEVVGHTDHVESGVICGASDPGQRLRHAGRSAIPGVIRDLHTKFHAACSVQSVGLKTIAQITDASTSRLSQLRTEIRCRKAATRGSLGPAVRASAPSSAAGATQGDHAEEDEDDEAGQSPDNPERGERNTELTGHPQPGDQDDAHRRSDHRPPEGFALLSEGGDCRWLTHARQASVEHRQGEDASYPDCHRGNMHEFEPEIERIHMASSLHLQTHPQSAVGLGASVGYARIRDVAAVRAG